MKALTNEGKARFFAPHLGVKCNYEWIREPNIPLIGNLTPKSIL